MTKQFDNDLLVKAGKKYIAGYDEAGRGACCYSFVSACCVPNKDYFNPEIKDSKQLTETKRFELESEIKENSISWDVIEFSNKEIDTLGIQKINKMSFETLKNTVCLQSVLHVVDGDIMKDAPWCISLIKGDQHSFAVACASILAKCHRDRGIIEISNKYPQYKLDHNKGYGQEYIKLVKEYGEPDIHRKSYKINKNDSQIKFF